MKLIDAAATILAIMAVTAAAVPAVDNAPEAQLLPRAENAENAQHAENTQNQANAADKAQIHDIKQVPQDLQDKAMEYAKQHQNDANLKNSKDSKQYWPYDNNRAPDGPSWVSEDALYRAQAQYLCQLGYVGLCEDGVTPFNKPSCYDDPQYCQDYYNYNRNPISYYGAQTYDPYTHQFNRGGIKTCKTDPITKVQTCVAKREVEFKA